MDGWLVNDERTNEWRKCSYWMRDGWMDGSMNGYMNKARWNNR